MKSIDDYFALQAEIFDYFGYVEDWRAIPLADARDSYWYLTGEGAGDEVLFADNEEDLHNDEGNNYSAEIYTQRFLPKWVYRGKEFTMVCVDTHTDGNKFLMVFDNEKESPSGGEGY